MTKGEVRPLSEWALRPLTVLALLPCLDMAAQDCSSIIAGPDTIGVCPGSTLTFDGSGSIGAGISTYEWLFSDGTAASGALWTRIYENPGSHEAQLVIADDTGCSDTSSVVIQVSPRADLFFEVGQTQCLGDTFSISATSVQPPIYLYTEAPTLLPDLGTTSLAVEVDQFPPDALITAGSDIATICVAMEHSFMGDLLIQLTCPNGDTLVMHQGGGGGTYLGIPVDGDPTTPIPGGCWHYCWGSAATLGSWQECSAYGTTPNVTYYGSNPSLQAGTYSSLNSFDDLVGCPLNGTWTLNIRDTWAGDNGYLCGWHLQFDGQPFVGPDSNNVTIIAPQIGWDCDSITWQGPGILANNPSCSTIQTAANSPGSNLYTLSAMDDHGCIFSGSTTVDVLNFAPQISGPTMPPYGIPVNYSVEVSAGSPSYLWTSNTAAIYFFNQSNAQAAWTTSENSWIAVMEFRDDCIGTDTLFIEGIAQPHMEQAESSVAYPNPANELLIIPSAIAPAGALSLRIVDPIGRSISSGTVDGNRPFQLDTRTIPTGSYILEMEGPDKVRSLSFMVLH